MTSQARAHAIVENYGDPLWSFARELEDAIATAIIEAVQAEREACATVVPTGWLSPLLSGDHAVIGHPPYDCSDIENLLEAVQAAIREARP